MKKIGFISILVMAMVLFALNIQAQTTTSSINGKVVTDNGESLPAATVIVTHVPTGAVYGSITDEKGNYRLPNLNVGGPYTLKVTFIGYHDYEQKEIYLSLGQGFKLDVNLQEESTEIDVIEVIAKQVADYKVIDGNRTGAETVVSSDQISKLPSVARDLTDFTRLTPQASVGDEGYLTVAGINNRYNQILIDGAVNNDVFGLAASGTNGGQTGASPISMDVIEQFQVTLAPYDVRQSGFAGASINAVTKSGSNKFKGTAYYLTRNENLAGKTPTDDESRERTKLAPFTNRTIGASIGGPIIKNKLFFFVNAESMIDETPLPFDFADYEGNSTLAEVEAVANKLKNDYGYNPGEFLDKTKSLNSTKLFGRIDWNINQNHKLMLRHSYTKSILSDASKSSSGSLGFSNNYMYFPSTTNSTTLELKSNFDNFSNDLLITSTIVTDDRDPKGESFPAVRVYDGSGTLYFGSEPYSTANALDQNILSITDNFQLYKGNHTLTFGVNAEFASVYNLFMRKNFGEYRFGSVDAFMNGEDAIQFERGYSLVDDIVGDGSAAAADFDILQVGVYGQDEWQVSDEFKLTAGLRIDMPIFLTQPPVDDHFNNTTIPMLEAAGWDLQGAQAGQMPKSQLMFSPRVGFNYNVNGEGETQLRGGIGIFTSRLPLVWPGGSFTNSGVVIGGVYVKSSWGYDIPFNPNWDAGIKNSNFGLEDKPYSGQIDLFTENYKFPQMFRGNFAVDQKLPWGMIGTLELLYTKTLNNVNYQNINIDPDAVKTLSDGRPNFSDAKIDGSYTRIMLGSNTNKGYTYNITAQLQKPFENGLTASLAYTFGRSMTINDGTSSQNSSQWLYMESATGLNDLELSVSDFDLGHRVTGFVSYEKEYIDHLKSTFSLFYTAESGKPFSYVYRRNSNYESLDGFNEYDSDLIFIPETQSDIKFADEATASSQWADLDAFIESDPYLSKHRGEFAQRNGGRAPMFHVFDFKFTQDLYVNVKDSKQTLQFSFDVFNLGNLLNKDWGRRYYVPYGNKGIIDFVDFDADGETPLFKYTNGPDYNPNYIDDVGINSSRWQAQIGLRYIF